MSKTFELAMGSHTLEPINFLVGRRKLSEVWRQICYDPYSTFAPDKNQSVPIHVATAILLYSRDHSMSILGTAQTGQLISVASQAQTRFNQVATSQDQLALRVKGVLDEAMILHAYR